MCLFKSLRKVTILPWLLGGLMSGVILALVLIVGGLFTRSRSQLLIKATPVLTIIPAPSVTHSPEPSITPEIAAVPPTATPRPSDTGEIGKGQLVEIHGTGGDNLRLRARPGLEASIAFLGVESEVFEVLDGPQEVDGYTWWYLRNPYNAEKTGWAVSVYLRPISSP
jgi:hypothetical protein